MLMNYIYLKKTIGLLFFAVLLVACKQKAPEHDASQEQAANEQQFMATLETHLKAVSEKNLALLKTTLQPNGVMYLALPQAEPTATAAAFLRMHESWFKEPNWTLEAKIMNSDIGIDLGVATVESMYKEKERNGRPYFNRMAVTYTLKRIANKWYVIRDHANSIEKTGAELNK
jgi:hypothetical protein